MRLQQPTRGFSIQRGFRRAERSAFLCRNADSAGRASPPLLFGLAPRGVCHAGDITAAAVGSYPTFSPLPAREPCRHPEGFPSVCHRVTHRRRYFLCGTFRDAVACATSPPGVTRRVTLLRMREVVSGLSSRQVRLRKPSQRSSSSSASHYYNASRMRTIGLLSDQCR